MFTIPISTKVTFGSVFIFIILSIPKHYAMKSIFNRLYTSIIEERKILFILPLLAIAYLILFLHLG